MPSVAGDSALPKGVKLGAIRTLEPRLCLALPSTSLLGCHIIQEFLDPVQQAGFWLDYAVEASKVVFKLLLQETSPFSHRFQRACLSSGA